LCSFNGEFCFEFETILGAEVADQSKNWNITRSSEWTLLQSIDHLGILASTKFGPIGFKAGIANSNSVLVSSPDVNSEKSYLGQIAFTPNDAFSVAGSILYGAEGPATIAGFPHTGTANGRRTGLFDLLANYTGDHFSAWADADYTWLEQTQAAAWALAVAGKVPITQALWTALRLEYLRNRSGFIPIGTTTLIPPFPPGHTNPFQNSEIYRVTGTLGYLIAENLTLKGEVRWDQVVEEGLPTRAFLTTTPHGSNDQVVGIAQVIYAF